MRERRFGASAAPLCRALRHALIHSKLGALTADLCFTREQVGKINVNEWSTYLAVDRNIAQRVASRLNDGRIKGKSVKVRVLED